VPASRGIDGSAHAWFEDRGPRCCLLVFIDDATSRLTRRRFVPQECTLGYMQTLHGHIRQHGLPMTLYSDRHGIFRVNLGDARDDAVSQFGRALDTLGIASIGANSPQAKGRVERANGVLQDRLVKALRLAGIDTIEAANAWLPGFIERHNARFAVPPSMPPTPTSPTPAPPAPDPGQALSAQTVEQPDLPIPFHAAADPTPGQRWRRPARRGGHRRRTLRSVLRSPLANRVLGALHGAETPPRAARTRAPGSRRRNTPAVDHHPASEPSVEEHPDRKTESGVHRTTMSPDPQHRTSLLCPEPDISTLP
jgi:hypothetical protein